MYKRHTGQVSMLESPEMFGSLPLDPKNDWIKLSKLGNEQGTVLRSPYQPLTALYITPTLIPVSRDACLIDMPPFSAFRRTSSRLLLSNP